MSSEHTPQSVAATESRRMRAWELHLQGWSQKQIAVELGVTQGAVSQWFKRVHGGGVEALRRHPAPGRQSALTPVQIGLIPTLLARGVNSFGYADGRWTIVRVADVIKTVFGVSYHPAHVSRLLRKHYPNWREM